MTHYQNLLIKSPSKIVHLSAFLLLQSDFIFSSIRYLLMMELQKWLSLLKKFLYIVFALAAPSSRYILFCSKWIKFSFFFLLFIIFSGITEKFSSEQKQLIFYLYYIIFINVYPQDYLLLFLFSFVFNGKNGNFLCVTHDN